MSANWSHWLILVVIVAGLAILTYEMRYERRERVAECQPPRHDAEPSPAFTIIEWPIDREEQGW